MAQQKPVVNLLEAQDDDAEEDEYEYEEYEDEVDELEESKHVFNPDTTPTNLKEGADDDDFEMRTSSNHDPAMDEEMKI